MIKVEYVYNWDEFGYSYRELPHKNSKLTGKYKELDGKLYVQVEERWLFDLIKRKRWISEGDFIFSKVEYFECKEGE